MAAQRQPAGWPRVHRETPRAQYQVAVPETECLPRTASAAPEGVGSAEGSVTGSAEPRGGAAATRTGVYGPT